MNKITDIPSAINNMNAEKAQEANEAAFAEQREQQERVNRMQQRQGIFMNTLQKLIEGGIQGNSEEVVDYADQLTRETIDKLNGSYYQGHEEAQDNE